MRKWHHLVGENKSVFFLDEFRWSSLSSHFLPLHPFVILIILESSPLSIKNNHYLRGLRAVLYYAKKVHDILITYHATQIPETAANVCE